MKDLRYLLRVAVRGDARPSQAPAFLEEAKRSLAPLRVQAVNLRVSDIAIEFDVFCPPGTDVSAFAAALQPMGPLLTCRLLEEVAGPHDADQVVAEAKAFFNQQRFWEVHEVLEGLWRTLKDPEKRWVQGIILISAAFVHAQKEELSVIWPMWQDGLHRLSDSPDAYHGWDLSALKKHVLERLNRRDRSAFTV